MRRGTGKAKKAYREDQETAINKYKLEDKQELVKIQAAVQCKIKTLLFKYWCIVYDCSVLNIGFPVMRF